MQTLESHFVRQIIEEFDLRDGIPKLTLEPRRQDQKGTPGNGKRSMTQRDRSRA
jgi:hypothetical protein